jgi:hypothetical protein
MTNFAGCVLALSMIFGVFNLMERAWGPLAFWITLMVISVVVLTWEGS